MSGTAPRPRPDPDTDPTVLRLPHLDEEATPGGGFVRRAVGLTLGTVGALVVVSLLVAALVEMDVTVKGAGVLEPVRVWPVRAMEAGMVREVLVQTGDTVRLGQPLVRLDELELRSTLAQLESRHRAAEIDRRRAAAAAPLEQRQQGDRTDQARARLVTARAQLRQRMVENSLGTDPDSLLDAYRPGLHVAVDLAVAEVRAAEAELRVAAGQGELLALDRYERERTAAQQEELAEQIRQTRERLERLGAASPIHGVVMTEQLERMPGTFVRPGDLLLEVADLGEWRATLYVSERDVHKIRPGDSVHVEVHAFHAASDAPLRGSVVHVAADPVASEGAAGQPASPGTGSGMYRVVARLDQAQIEEMGLERFRRGFTVQGKVVTRSGRILRLLWDYVNDRLEGRA